MALLIATSTIASADVVLKLGDILVAEPGTSSISVVDPATGVRTVISEGGLLSPAHRTIGVALARNGSIIVVHRTTGLIRVNPANGAQSILSQGGHFRDPWAIAVNKDTGDIYVADSGYDNDRPEVNEAGKIIRVDPVSGAQEIIAQGTPCNFFPSNAACQNTTSAGSYLAHPYGIAIDYAVSPGTLVVADMGSFNGKGAIVRIQPSLNGTQTLVWGPASAVPPPQVAQLSPLGCPMGVAVEPTGNILATVFSYPVPPAPSVPPPAGTFYGCAPPGIFRIDLVNHVQSVVNANGPEWEAARGYAVGDVIRDETSSTSHVHRVVTAGVSQSSSPAWNSTPAGTTVDGSVVWQNIGLGANWLIPFGVDIEPAPTPADPSRYNIIVGDEGYSMLFRLGADGALSSGPVATDTSYVTSIDVITFMPQGGSTPPVRSNGQPVGTLPFGTTQATMSLATDGIATCRYSLQAGVAYGSMANTFATTGFTTHSTTLNGLTNGGSFTFYVRCADTGGNANPDDFVISFSVAGVPTGLSNFSGTENPLSENGVWDSPGAWADLQKNDGAFASGLNAQGRLVAPVLSANQYSEITYGQDPGSSSWVGVTTRVQGAGNGSGYLAIVYAGEVRLYRADDSGSLSFTQLAFAGASIGTAPRRLRLESEGNNHRVYFNGTQVIDFNASGTVYSIGQPGIAASVFGGPQVKILSFAGGNIGTPSSDTTPPVRSNGQPVGTLASGTTQATLSLATAENATCRYSPQAGVAYGSMTTTFTTTGAMTHSRIVNGLTNGTSYTFNIRCIDVAGNANIDDFVIAFAVSDPGSSSIPAGAQASYAFGNLNGTTIPNLIQSAGALPQLTVWGSDRSVANDEVVWNAQIGGFTHTFPFEASNGTFAETVTSFPNSYGSGGTLAVRLRLASTVATLGQASSMGILAFRPDPEVNIHKVTPRGLELHREGPTDPLHFLVREGNNSIGYNSEFNDEVRSGPLSNLTVDTTVIVVWDPQTLRIYLDGVLAGTTSRVTIDHPTPNYRVMVATSPSLIHGGDRQFYEGALRSLVIYNRALTDAEIASLNSALNSGLGGPPSDTTPPARSNGQPVGTLASGTTQAILSLATGENATCRYSQQAGMTYGLMTSPFSTTGATTHTSVVTGLANGGTYSFYVRCADPVGNANPDDFVISFSVANSTTGISTFSGTENPLFENGVWDSPGAWADLHKNNGAFASGLNAQARLVAPTVAPDQYSEITFNQDPGSSSWVGVTTRVQGAGNGSGYLAIVYAGEVRLYRADDSGSLSFTQLASASAAIGAAPRRLRLESQGDNHRVYFNGTQVINYNASGAVYSSGQPGIAASVFGGPQVGILSFAGGNIIQN